MALAHRHHLDAGEEQIEAEGEVGIRIYALAQGYRSLHEPRVAFGRQRLQEESGAPPVFQQLSFTSEVPVEGHGRHAKLLGQPPDRNRPKPFRVGERERPLDHRPRREGRPAGRVSTIFLGHHLTIVRCTGNLYTCTLYRYNVKVPARASSFVVQREGG